jgi:serine-type D-Ala-D-Ala carboxypeptidase
MNLLMEKMVESMTSGIEGEVFPGGISSVALAGNPPLTVVKGKLTYGTEAADVSIDTLYDLASLTKVTATLPAILLSVQSGKLLLSDCVEEYIPEFCTGNDSQRKRQITIFHLLTHTSGLPAWRPYFVTCNGPEEYIMAISTDPLIGEPGRQVVYSDLGFMLLGFILERIWDMKLEEIAEQLIFHPLGMSSTGYRPTDDPVLKKCSIAPTELGNQHEKNTTLAYLEEQKQHGAFVFSKELVEKLPWRDEMIVGTVHDGNAFYGLNGVSGHAGLFSTISDLQRYMEIWSAPNNSFIDPLLREFAANCQTGLLVPRRALGWEAAAAGGTIEQVVHSCSGGDLVSASAFGHTGFTGTSMWHDPVRQSTLIILTNRVHPKVNNAILKWRKKHANLIFAEVGIAKGVF